MISRMPSYHGATFGALGVTGYEPLNAPFRPMVQEMPKIPAPRAYLDRDNFSDAERGLRYAEMLREKILEVGAETVLAFIMEPIGGASTGALVAPDTYYKRIREICDEFGILLIYDEVMTGAGRTGKYLAAEHWGINPDIIAMAKGLGAGYVPLGAMLAHERIVEPVLDSGGFAHGYTYAGNPLACAAGLAVIDEIFDQDLMGNTVATGDCLKAELTRLMDRYPFIGDVRGKGLLLAFELVADRETMAPLPKEANAYLRLVELAYERGLIIYSRRTRGGLEGDHFLVCPPMITTNGTGRRNRCDPDRPPSTTGRRAAAAGSGLGHFHDTPSKKVIITCAVTGSVHTPTMSPYLPVTPEQIAAAVDRRGRGRRRDPASACPRPEGRPAVRRPGSIHGASCRGSSRRCDAVINISTGGSSLMSAGSAAGAGRAGAAGNVLAQYGLDEFRALSRARQALSQLAARVGAEAA